MKTVRVAITGLTRAGKTVFLTSLINHLLEGSEETLREFAKRRLTFAAEKLPVGSQARPFPYARYLDAYRREQAAWPEPTAEVTKFRLHLKMKNRKDKRRDVVLEFVDYPGERLLDLPLTRMSFEEWSRRILADASLGVKREVSKQWRRSCEQLLDGHDRRIARPKSIVGKYRKYVLACKARGLPFVQPSAMLLHEEGFAKHDSAFCPLPGQARDSVPRMAKLFQERYRAYVMNYVKPFFQDITNCSRQVVLVDVLDILRRDVDSLNDTRKCLRLALDVFGYGQRSPWYLTWLDLFRGAFIDRVAFVATKADQAPKDGRTRMKDLLRQVVERKYRDLQFQMKEGTVKFFFCSANRCTKDVSGEYQGDQVWGLRGLIGHESADSEVDRFPGRVPQKWADAWNAMSEGYRFPDFLPRRLPRREGAAIPHMNLDKVLCYVLDEVLPL